MTDYKNELERDTIVDWIDDRRFDKGFPDLSYKEIEWLTDNCIIPKLEALLSKRELEAYKKGYIDGGIHTLTNREEK